MSEPSRAVPRTPLLLYDADCSFCSASARWLERRARRPLAILPIAEAPAAGVLRGLGERELWAGAHLVSAEGHEHHGAAAVTQALRLGPGGRLWALLDWPPLAPLRDGGYRLVAALRGRSGCRASTRAPRSRGPRGDGPGRR